MNIGKKAAFLGTVAGALVLGAGGAASACTHHFAPGGASQHNECSTSTGETSNVGVFAPAGEVEISSNCANIAAG